MARGPTVPKRQGSRREVTGPAQGRAPDKALLAAVVESSDDAILSCSLDGNVTSWNGAAESIYGFAPDEMLGAHLSRLAEPGAEDGFIAALERVGHGERVEHFDTTRRRRDGTPIAVSVTMSAIRDAAGEIVGISSIDRDITERERVHDGANHSSQYARSLIEASLDPLVTISAQGKVTDVNEAAVRVTGVARDRLIGTDFSDYFTEPDQARQGYERVFAEGFVTDYPLTIRHTDGTLTDVLYNASVYKDPTGQVAGVFAAARDVTESRRSSQYARSLIEASLDPLVTISAQGKITDVNEATVRVTGVDRDRLIGTDFSDYFTERDEARKGYERVFAEGFVTDYPLTIRHTDGTLTDVLYNASVYKDPTGQVLGVFAAARDVTESRQVLREFSETKNFLDNILQSSTKYSIIGKDLDHRILSWNEGARRNYGYTADQILGSDSSILHTPEDVASGAVEQLLTQARERGLAEGTFERVRRDGSRFFAGVVVTRRDDDEGRPIGYLLMSNDISETLQAEEQLRSASQYARSLIEASLDPLVTISAQGKITDVNEATVRVTGVDRDRLIGTDFSDYFTEPDEARKGYERVFAEGFVTDYPLTIRHTDGTLTDVLYNASVYKDPTGQVLGVFAAARDVTAQRRAEAALGEQRARELERLAELERFQKLTVGRELRMIELKRELEELRAAQAAP
jgi:PAS domain S-box-containing protein